MNDRVRMVGISLVDSPQSNHDSVESECDVQRVDGNVQLVLFNDVLDHVLRIDRVFRQIQGHLLLIGVSGSGKVSLKSFYLFSCEVSSIPFVDNSLPISFLHDRHLV